MRKQLILIMTDTTRKDMLGCYGDSRMKTPNLDKMAEKGIRYDKAYCCQPVCGPSRSAIFTGTFPHSNGMVTNCVPLGANVKTIGQRLTDQGIDCGYVGKWHLDGGDYFGLGICPEGWNPDYWYDMKNYLDELSDEDKVRSRKPGTSFEQGLDETFTFAHRCTDRAIKYVEEFRDRDFFLTLSLDEPHDPSVCPEPFHHMYDDFSYGDRENFHDDLKDKPLMQSLWAGSVGPEVQNTKSEPSKTLSLFLGCNSFADYEIGRLLDVIYEKVPEAMVIYTSDHGDMLGAHGLFGKNAAAYEEQTNIPLIVRGGAVGKVVKNPASQIDLVPTILDYFELPVPKLLEGKSMLPQFYDPEIKINDEVYAEFTRYEIDHDGFGGLQIMRAIITDRYKLVIYLLDSDEFYDLSEDPYENVNLINEERYAGIRNELHDKLLEHMNETRDMYRGYQWAVRPWRREKQALWENDGYTRQRENEEYEPRQRDYATGLPMTAAVRKKGQPANLSHEIN